jgi:uncharacterized protein (DUF58 family)
MRIHSTSGSLEIGLSGIACVAAGIMAQQPAIVAWGGSLIVGLAIARAVTELSVARIRAAGFEMLWRSEPRLRRVSRGDTVEIEAEIRNRDSRATRYVQLRAVSSPELDARVEPEQGEVPAGGRLRAVVRVHVPRVGRHGIHGLSLELRGNTGLFEVPLTFANPFGVEVMPRAFATFARSARGGRSRIMTEVGRSGPLAGDGNELRELREHHTGDPFKRIAWKASARRGKLLVRDYEQEERDVVWLLLDASVELWAGKPGTAPLDLAIDEVAAVAQRHLARGDSVGLGVLASRTLAWLEPGRGPGHGVKMMTALAHAGACYDADRSDLDEPDVAMRVLEHMRPLDPAAVQRVRPNELDRLMRRAERLKGRGPFFVPAPEGATPRERVLRQYMAAFGLYAPPRIEPERQHTDAQIARALIRVRRERPRASIVYVWSPPPDTFARAELERALRKFPKRQLELFWISMDHEPSVPRSDAMQAAAVADAVAIRVRIARERGERLLRAMGLRVTRVRPTAPLHPSEPMPEQ